MRKSLATKVAFAGLLLAGLNVYANVSNQEDLDDILKSPDKFAKLKMQGPHVYGDLKKLAFDEDRNMNIRWRAFMTMVQMGEKESIPEVKEALASSDWFMRNAALKVFPVLDPSQAYKAAKEKLKDSSLVVRTAAVDALKKVGDSECATNLWEELYSKENFMHHQSLWIRRHVVEALAELSPKGTEEKFIKVLDDKDKTLAAPAMKGLERLAGQAADATFSWADKKMFWKTWFKNQADKTATR